MDLFETGQIDIANPGAAYYDKYLINQNIYQDLSIILRSVCITLRLIVSNLRLTIPTFGKLLALPSTKIKLFFDLSQYG